MKNKTTPSRAVFNYGIIQHIIYKTAQLQQASMALCCRFSWMISSCMIISSKFGLCSGFLCQQSWRSLSPNATSLLGCTYTFTLFMNQTHLLIDSGYTMEGRYGRSSSYARLSANISGSASLFDGPPWNICKQCQHVSCI